MNKISKKIVALVTMAAFVLTLVPAAAFAATENVDPTKSSVQTEAKNVNVETGDSVEYVLNLKDSSNAALKDGQNQVYVWVEDEEHNVVRNVTFYDDANGKNPVGNGNIAWIDNGKALKSNASYDGRHMSLSLSEAGTYTIKAGVIKNGATRTTASSRTDLTTLENVKDYETIVVADRAIESIGVWNDQKSPAAGMVDWNDEKIGEIDLTNYDGFVANGTDKYTVTGWVYDEAGNVLANRDVSLTSGRPDILALYGEAADGVVATNDQGQFTFQFTMNDNRNVPITISAGDKTYTLRILKESTRTYDIDTTVDNGYVLAGNDTANWTDAAREFTDAVQFSIKDIKGDAITGDLESEPATNNNSSDSVGALHAKYLDVTSKPEKSDLNAWELVLDWDEDHGVYTLRYVGAAGDQVKDLVPGQYTVSVALTSGDYATATFNVAKFGTVKDTVLDMQATDRSANNRTTTITDEVTLGQNVSVSAKYVDENGLKIPATGVSFGFDGKAVVDRSLNGENGFATKDDIAANESLLGTTITVTAFSKGNHQLVQKELTVVDSYNSFGLEFDPTEGPVNEDNAVAVKVVKEDGSIAQVSGTLQAYVADQSNEDAVVSVETSDNVSKGKGELTVYASEPTEVDIVVAVDDETNDGLYAGTLKYTVGDVDITAHHNVTMTIGSSEYVVDKQLFTMDAAPYVDSNWRTMVPIRALAEAFDADVKWNNDDRTVTIKYNEQTIVMTIGEKDYTVNGETATMDTEAVIQGDRTYVPIRFAAEAMGFTVTPLYNENSSTASVVFQS